MSVMNGRPNGPINGRVNGHVNEINHFASDDVVQFLEDVHKMMVDKALIQGTGRDEKVVEFYHPKELEKMLDLTIDGERADHKTLLDWCEKFIKLSVKTGSPRFYNQLYGGVDPYGLAGSWLTDSLNTNMHTYEVSPVFSVLENFLAKKVCNLIGYKDGNGVFCPGGSFMNIMGVHLGRYKLDPDFKKSGLFGKPKMIIYASDGCHYSILHAATFLGIGSENVVKVLTDDRGRMLPEELEKQILKSKKEGSRPMVVIATCGTTVLGAFDPLNPLADICERHNLWLHVDAAWGGSVLLSNKLRGRMVGIERTDSLAWNFHKMSSAPVQCSLLVVREKNYLQKCNSIGAEYLYQSDKYYDRNYDPGNKTIQCGRKVDVLKLWLMWKAKGDRGMAEKVEKAVANARYLTEQLRRAEGFRLVFPEIPKTDNCKVCMEFRKDIGGVAYEYTNIGFWYIPPSLRGQPETPEWWDKLSKVAPKIKERMVSAGTLMIGYQPLSSKGIVNFFRIIICNDVCDESDMDYVVEEIDRLGRDL